MLINLLYGFLKCLLSISSFAVLKGKVLIERCGRVAKCLIRNVLDTLFCFLVWLKKELKKRQRRRNDDEEFHILSKSGYKTN